MGLLEVMNYIELQYVAVRIYYGYVLCGSISWNYLAFIDAS